MSVRRIAVRVGVGLCVGSASLMFGTGVALANPGGHHGGNGADGNRVTICHATGSASNPYVVITPDAAGVANGHYPHQDERDIIPPFSFDGQSYAGHNWNSGEAIWNNGCSVPTNTPGTGNENPGGNNPGGNQPGGNNPGGGTHQGGDQLKVTICHATGSATNPFVRISPAAEGVINGHYGHQDGRDIIPPFSYQGHSYAGQNWDSAGQATYNNGCTVPAAPQTPGTPGTPGMPGTPGTPGAPGTPMTPGVTVGSATTPTAATAGAGTSAARAGSTGTAHTVPSGSVHAGMFDGGPSAGQWAGIALMGTALTSAGVLITRRRLGRAGA